MLKLVVLLKYIKTWVKQHFKNTSKSFGVRSKNSQFDCSTSNITLLKQSVPRNTTETIYDIIYI